MVTSRSVSGIQATPLHVEIRFLLPAKSYASKPAFLSTEFGISYDSTGATIRPECLLTVCHTRREISAKNLALLFRAYRNGAFNWFTFIHSSRTVEVGRFSPARGLVASRNPIIPYTKPALHRESRMRNDGYSMVKPYDVFSFQTATARRIWLGE